MKQKEEEIDKSRMAKGKMNEKGKECKRENNIIDWSRREKDINVKRGWEDAIARVKETEIELSAKTLNRLWTKRDKQSALTEMRERKR